MKDFTLERSFEVCRSLSKSYDRFESAQRAWLIM